MSNGLLFVLLSLAAFRVWRLIGRDDITGGVREFVYDHLPRFAKDWFTNLVTCPWCAGSWCSFAAVWIVHATVVTLEPHPVLWALGVAGAVGFLGEIDGKLSE